MTDGQPASLEAGEGIAMRAKSLKKQAAILRWNAATGKTALQRLAELRDIVTAEKDEERKAGK